ncbi:MAG: DUF4878 domain-containing protein [Chitinophagaceae bacterium]
MKKIFSSLLILTMMGIIGTGCGGGSMNNASPKEVLVAFFEKLSKKDLEGAAKLATKDSKSTIDMMKKAFDMSEKMKDQMKDAKQDDPAEEFKNMEIGEAKITGDLATVAVKNKKKETEVEFPLKKEDGGWKVDFSMATLMKMGMDQKNKHSESGEDMNPMQGADSASIQDGLKMMDSVLKTVDPKKLEETMKALEKLKQPQ